MVSGRDRLNSVIAWCADLQSMTDEALDARIDHLAKADVELDYACDDDFGKDEV